MVRKDGLGIVGFFTLASDCSAHEKKPSRPNQTGAVARIPIVSHAPVAIPAGAMGDCRSGRDFGGAAGAITFSLVRLRTVMAYQPCSFIDYRCRGIRAPRPGALRRRLSKRTLGGRSMVVDAVRPSIRVVRSSKAAPVRMPNRRAMQQARVLPAQPFRRPSACSVGRHSLVALAFGAKLS